MPHTSRRCGLFCFFFNVASCAGDILLPDIRPRSHSLCTYATTPPTHHHHQKKKNKSPSSLCSSVADGHRCSRAPVENAMRRCYGWGIDKYWKEDDLLSWQPRCTLECSITRRARAVQAAPAGECWWAALFAAVLYTLKEKKKTKETQRPHKK